MRMLSKSDLKWLKENLASKDDLKNFATKDDLKDFAKQKDLLLLKQDLKKLEKRLNKKFTDLFNFIDKDVMKNKRKIKTIEQFLQIPSVS